MSQDPHKCSPLVIYLSELECFVVGVRKLTPTFIVEPIISDLLRERSPDDNNCLPHVRNLFTLRYSL